MKLDNFQTSESLSLGTFFCKDLYIKDNKVYLLGLVGDESYLSLKIYDLKNY